MYLFYKYFNILRKYINNISYLVLSRIVNGTVNLFTTILLIKILTPIEYGLFILTISMEGRFGLIGLPGMGFVLQRSILKGNSIDYKLIQKITFIVVIFLSILIIGFSLFNIFLISNYPPLISFLKDFRWDLLIIAVLIILFKSPNRYESYLINTKKFKKFFYYKLFFSSLYLLILVSSAYFFKDLFYVLTGLIIHSFIMLLLSQLLINKEILEKNDSLKNPFKDGFKYSALNISSFIFRFERIVLGSISPESLGVLNIAEKIPNISRDLLKTLIIPKLISFGRNSRKSNFIWISKNYIYLFIFGFLSFFVISAFTYFIYPILFPLEYHDGQKYSYLISLMLLPYFFNTILQNFNTVQDRGEIYRKYNFCYPIIFGIVCYYTIPLYGLIGIIYAMFIKTILQVLCSIEIYLKAKKLII